MLTMESPEVAEQGVFRDSQIEFDLVTSLLNDPAQFNDVSDITPEMFSDTNMRKLWMVLYERKGRIAPAALVHEMGKIPGGHAALDDISSGTVSTHDQVVNFLFEAGVSAGPAESLAPIIRENATKRFVEQAKRDIRPEQFSNSIDYASALSNRIAKIASSMSPNVRSDSLLDGIDEAYQNFLWMQNNPDKVTGIRVGWEDYDNESFGLQKGEIIIVGGHSGEGKTQLKANWALGAAKMVQDVIDRQPHVLYFSLEMRSSEMASRWLSNLAGISLRERHLTKTQLSDVARANIELRQLATNRNLIVVDAAEAHTLDQIIRRMHKAKTESGLDMAVIDYAQLIGVSSAGEASKYEQMAQVAQRLKVTAQQLEIPIVLGAQLNRDAMNNSPCGRPRAYHVADSLDLVRSADVIQMIWTPARHINTSKTHPWGKIAVLLTEKVRSRAMSPELYYHFDFSTTSFEAVNRAVKEVLLDEESQEWLKGGRRAAAKTATTT